VATPGKDVLSALELAPGPRIATIDVALKIWRYDAEAPAEKELKRYEVEAARLG